MMMRRKRLRVVAAWLVSGAAACVFAERNIYVATEAEAGGDGSRRRPHQTLEQARDAIRAARKDGSLASGEAVTVLVGPGVYRQQAAFELTAEDSGSEGAPVVYRAQKRGQARLHGGITLDAADFTAVTDPAVLARLDPSVREQVRVCDLSRLVPDAAAAVQDRLSRRAGGTGFMSTGVR